jgi:hypothetical protein
MPTGFLMPRRNSTWAPSSCFVRSPSQTRWAELWRRLRIEAARRHEIERLGQPVGQRAVALALRRAFDEILVPGVYPVQIGIAALGEGAQ